MCAFQDEENYNAIMSDLYDMIKVHFHVSLEKYPQPERLNLFGYDVNLSEESMLYLIRMIEKKYDITFTEIDYDNDDLYVVGGIAMIVLEKINAKQMCEAVIIQRT